MAEAAFIRVMKGLGFVIFTVMVALPFYVMVMTSLKNQAELLANPLDLSIDLSQGFARPVFQLCTSCSPSSISAAICSSRSSSPPRR
jgi:ABC-type glycerol-3-phosphate transport system permease component